MDRDKNLPGELVDVSERLKSEFSVEHEGLSPAVAASLIDLDRAERRWDDLNKRCGDGAIDGANT